MRKQEASARDLLLRFSKCRTLKHLYEAIVDIAQKESNAKMSVLFIEEYDEEKGKILKPVANRNFPTVQYTQNSKSLTTFIWNQESTDALVEIKNKAQLSAFFKQTYGIKRKQGEHHRLTYKKGGDFHSVIGTPLVFRGKCYGVLKVENKLNKNNLPQIRGFTEEDKNMFQVIASSAALHISSLMEKDYIIDILNEVSHIRKREELYRTVVALAKKYSNSESSSLFIVTPDSKRLMCKKATGKHARLEGEEYRLSNTPQTVTEYLFKIPYDDKRFKNNLVHISYGPTGNSKMKRKSFINEAGYKVYNGLSNFYKEVYGIKREKGLFHELTYSREGGFYNVIGTPLIVGRKCYGILKVENKKGNKDDYVQFSEYDMEIFMSIAICAALHISSYSEQYANITRISTNIIHNMLNKVGPIKDNIKSYSQKLSSRGDPLGEDLEKVLKDVETLERSMSEVGEVHKIRYYPLTIESAGAIFSHLVKSEQAKHTYYTISYESGFSNDEEWLIKRANKIVMNTIFENVVSNSIKHFYRNERKNKIKVKLFPIRRGDENKLCIEISDNGEGIDMRYKDNLERIFEPLSSEDSGTGTGLGLWLVNEYVEEMGGAISVNSVNRMDSRKFSGTKINIELPITEMVEKKRTLLLEDNSNTKLSIQNQLRPYCDIISVDNIKDFWKIFSISKFDVVLCDHRLPKGNRGANIIRRISKLGFSRIMILYSRYDIPGVERSGVDALKNKRVNVIENSTVEKVLFALLENFYEQDF